LRGFESYKVSEAALRVLLQGEYFLKIVRIFLIVAFLYVTHGAEYRDNESIPPWLKNKLCSITFDIQIFPTVNINCHHLLLFKNNAY